MPLQILKIVYREYNTKEHGTVGKEAPFIAAFTAEISMPRTDPIGKQRLLNVLGSK